MSEDAAFLQAITAAPGDNTARLVYADWLDEQGRPGGNFLRVECDLATLGLHDPRRAEILGRLRTESKDLEDEWVTAVSRVPVSERFAPDTEPPLAPPPPMPAPRPLVATTAKDCPACGLVNTPSATRCDCGYDFITRSQRQSYLGHGAERRSGLNPSFNAVDLVVCALFPPVGLLYAIAHWTRGRHLAGTRVVVWSSCWLIFCGGQALLAILYVLVRAFADASGD